VKDGIGFVKTLTLHTKPGNVNFDAEIAAYRWKKKKDGEVEDEPLEYDDHLMDAMRYPLWTHLANPTNQRPFSRRRVGL
jgi:phage terminase large subunit